MAFNSIRSYHVVALLSMVVSSGIDRSDDAHRAVAPRYSPRIAVALCRCRRRRRCLPSLPPRHCHAAAGHRRRAAAVTRVAGRLVIRCRPSPLPRLPQRREPPSAAGRPQAARQAALPVPLLLIVQDSAAASAASA
ncbi:hypothetical protein Scep_015847 [Stephania cephalantha]|uniref:Uncharacterized protein n=1 Tax=Stephania cephalantha TaxID=152367 RepID=A0AAP0P495_9MAGN